MALTLAIAAGAGDAGRWCWRRARGAPTGCWLPVFLVVANFIEWMVHRNPMHRPLRPRIMYKNHAQLHHLAFTDANMPIDRDRRAGPDHDALVHDARPVRRRVAGHGRSPACCAARGWRASSCWARSRTSSATRLLHALYHLPDATLDRAGIGRLRAFRRLQAHHRHHHILRPDGAVNFNVTVPLMDRLLGTLEKLTRAAVATSSTGASFVASVLGADLRRRVDADRVALARQAEPGRGRRHRRRLGRLRLVGHVHLADLLPREERIVRRRQHLLLRPARRPARRCRLPSRPRP